MDSVAERSDRLMVADAVSLARLSRLGDADADAEADAEANADADADDDADPYRIIRVIFDLVGLLLHMYILRMRARKL